MKVTKASIRALTGRQRLPKRCRMFVAGSWLYDVLEANGLHKKVNLWQQTYWVVLRSTGPKELHLKLEGCKK